MGSRQGSAVTGKGVEQRPANVYETQIGSFKEALTHNRAGLHDEHFEELVTLSTTALYTDTSDSIPAGAVEAYVCTYVETALATATEYTVGISGAATRFLGTQNTVTAAATATGKDTVGTIFASASPIRITSTTKATAGAIRVACFYRVLTAPTS